MIKLKEEVGEEGWGGRFTQLESISESDTQQMCV